MTKDKVIDALKLAQDALHMATLPFPIDPVKTQRALEAVDKVLDQIAPDEMLFDDWGGVEVTPKCHQSDTTLSP